MIHILEDELRHRKYCGRINQHFVYIYNIVHVILFFGIDIDSTPGISCKSSFYVVVGLTEIVVCFEHNIRIP